jgi:hypothetical protein
VVVTTVVAGTAYDTRIDVLTVLPPVTVTFSSTGTGLPVTVVKKLDPSTVTDVCQF